MSTPQKREVNKDILEKFSTMLASVFLMEIEEAQRQRTKRTAKSKRK